MHKDKVTKQRWVLGLLFILGATLQSARSKQAKGHLKPRLDAIPTTHLPSIAVHSGLSQFCTQKLTWGSSYGIPFPIGRWKGVDGNTVIAALNPGDYVTKIRSDISVDPKWASERFTSVGNGRQIGFRYFGTGDIGGAPDEESVEWLGKSIASRAGNVDVRNTSSDQLARDLTPEE